MDLEVLYWMKTYGDHEIHSKASKTEDGWQVILRCQRCIKHYVFDNIDFDDDSSTTFLVAEMQMHGAGVDDGWFDGKGFLLEEELG